MVCVATTALHTFFPFPSLLLHSRFLFRSDVRERERVRKKERERRTKRVKDGGGVGGEKQLWDPFTCKWLKELPLIPERMRATPPLLPLPCQFPLPLLLSVLLTWLWVTHPSNVVHLSRNHAMLIENKWKTNRRYCYSVSEPAVWQRGQDKALMMMTWHIYHNLRGETKIDICALNPFFNIFTTVLSYKRQANYPL